MASTRFNVVLEGMTLTKSQSDALNKDIQALVAQHAAKINGSDAVIGRKNMIKLNPEWLGIWLRKFKTLDAIKASSTFKVNVLKG